MEEFHLVAPSSSETSNLTSLSHRYKPLLLPTNSNDNNNNNVDSNCHDSERRHTAALLLQRWLRCRRHRYCRSLSSPQHTSPDAGDVVTPPTMMSTTTTTKPPDPAHTDAAMTLQDCVRGRRCRSEALSRMGVAKRCKWEPRQRSARVTLMHSQLRRTARAFLREQQEQCPTVLHTSMVLAVR